MAYDRDILRPFIHIIPNLSSPTEINSAKMNGASVDTCRLRFCGSVVNPNPYATIFDIFGL